MTPEELLTRPPDELFSMPPADAEALRLQFVQQRYEELRPKLSFLDSLAKNNGVDAIDELDDAVPLLFPHTAYKSYPLRWLENGEFARLTEWLGGLTAHDLSGLDISEVDTIEGWLHRLDDHTPLRVTNSSGTSGKMSFLPRSESEMWAFNEAFRYLFLGIGDEPSVDLNELDLLVILFQHRHGFNWAHRKTQDLIDRVAGGDESNCWAMFDGWMSPDMLALAGRLAAAETKGDLNSAALPESLIERREEFRKFQEERPELTRQFIRRLDAEARGRPIITLSGWATMFDVAVEAETMGIPGGLFAPESVISVGGPPKMRSERLPDDHQERAQKFLGIPSCHQLYGMSEMSASMHICPSDHYHVPPYIVPYVLDPDAGQPLPRTGVRTGRFAYLDPLAVSYWGGLTSGDQVTIHWDDKCGCGRLGAFLEKEITRYSKLRGGDDKITCAGTPDAYDRALEFLLEGF